MRYIKQRSFYYFLIGLLFFSLGCQRAHSQSTHNEYQQAIVESRKLIDSLQEASCIPGLDIAVSIGGETIWSEGFGMADLEQHVSVKPGQTRFRIGSVSKPLTSVAMGVLMQQGAIDIDQPIQTYVPYFPEKKYKVSARQLSGHLGGIRTYRNNEYLNKQKYPTVKSGLEMFINDTLMSEPGTSHLYSSHGFNLLSAVLEGASGTDFLSLMQQAVFSPLGMHSTCADWNDSIIHDRTSFYRMDHSGTVVNAPYVDNSYKWAGGGFISTTSDLIKFGEAMMKPGFLNEKTLNELTTPQHLKNGKKTNYGMGWRIWHHNGQKVYGHGGGSVGGITFFKIYPASSLVIVILSNYSNTKYDDVPERIVEYFLSAGKEPEDLSTNSGD